MRHNDEGTQQAITLHLSRVSRRAEVAGCIAVSSLAFVATYLATMHVLVFMAHWQ
jgi:hypothetical protein